MYCSSQNPKTMLFVNYVVQQYHAIRWQEAKIKIKLK